MAVADYDDHSTIPFFLNVPVVLNTIVHFWYNFLGTVKNHSRNVVKMEIVAKLNHTVF